MAQILTVVVGVILIVFIGWWFFGKHSESQATAVTTKDGQTAKVVVNGGFNPAVLKMKKDTPVKLVFNRKDSTTCLEKVVFPDFGVDAELPMNQDVAIPIDTSKAGEFEYSCGMHMFHGKIVIK